MRPVDVATLAEEKARAAVQAELSMFEADRTVRKVCFGLFAAKVLHSCMPRFCTHADIWTAGHM